MTEPTTNQIPGVALQRCYAEQKAAAKLLLNGHTTPNIRLYLSDWIAEEIFIRAEFEMARNTAVKEAA